MEISCIFQYFLRGGKRHNRARTGKCQLCSQKPHCCCGWCILCDRTGLAWSVPPTMWYRSSSTCVLDVSHSAQPKVPEPAEGQKLTCSSLLASASALPGACSHRGMQQLHQTVVHRRCPDTSAFSRKDGGTQNAPAEARTSCPWGSPVALQLAWRCAPELLWLLCAEHGNPKPLKDSRVQVCVFWGASGQDRSSCTLVTIIWRMRYAGLCANPEEE